MKQERSETEQIIIDKPANFAASIKEEVCIMVSNGGQVNYNLVKIGLHRAYLLAILLKDGKVISCACSKSPQLSYRNSIFQSAKLSEPADPYLTELGHVTTLEGYKGKNFCQQLLNDLYPHISDRPMFATTRKPEMIHILNKFGFKNMGIPTRMILNCYSTGYNQDRSEKDRPGISPSIF